MPDDILGPPEDRAPIKAARPEIADAALDLEDLLPRRDLERAAGITTKEDAQDLLAERLPGYLVGAALALLDRIVDVPGMTDAQEANAAAALRAAVLRILAIFNADPASK